MPRSRFASLSFRSIAAVAVLGMAPLLSTASPATALAEGQAPEYLIEDLGVLPGATASYGTGINNAGEVAGYSNDGMFSRTSAVRWSGGTITGLGQFGCGGQGSAISDNSTVVGFSNLTCSEIDVHGFATSPEGLRDIGSLGGGVPTRAFGINSSDRIVGSSTDDHGNGRAFVSGPGGQFLQSIDVLSPDRPAGATAQQARGINAAGDVVGSAFFSDQVCGSHNPPFLYTADSGLQELRRPDGGCGSGVAFSINDSRVVAGYISTADTFAAHATRWTGGLAQDLGALLPYAGSFAQSINASGTTVGFAKACNICPTVPWVYADTGGMKLLNDLIDPSLGWSLLDATGINASGQIAGAGYHNSQLRAFRLTPVPRHVLQSVSVAPSTASVPAGTTQQFSATGRFSDGSTSDLTATATWTSSDPSVAQITAAGLATGARVGTTTLSATVGAVTGSATVTVTPATLRSVSISPANVSVKKTEHQQLAATGVYTDGSTVDLTTTVAWSSSDTSVAVVSTRGVLRAAGVGTATVTATSGTLSATAGVVVSPKK